MRADFRFSSFTRLRRNGMLGNRLSGGLTLLALMVVCCCWGRAETFKAPDPGRAYMPLTGTWQFHTGDDLAWANPAYNDADWQPVQGDEPLGMQGHAGLTGYAWYRKRIEIGPGGTPIGIDIAGAQGAYDVYWNGKRIGSSGSLPPHAEWFMYGQEGVFDLGGSGPISGVLALRFWLPAPVTLSDPSNGGLAYQPRLGYVDFLQRVKQARLDREAQAQQPGIIASSLTLILGLLSLWLFLRRRGEWLYLWLAILMFGKFPVGLQFLWAESVPFIPNELLSQASDICSTVGLWLVLLSLFGLSQRRRWRVITGIVLAVYLTAELVDNLCIVFWQNAGPGMMLTDRIATQIFTAIEFYVLVIIAFGVARNRSWSLAPLSAIAFLYGLFDPLADLLLLVNPAAGYALTEMALRVGSYSIFTSSILDWLLLLTLAVTVVLRQIREGRRQARLDEEVRSAQAVQRILIPEETPSVPGLTVESVYKPANEVGGDFFQVIPPEPGGLETGTLIVVGDVSGKGLPAAMTVSLIVGTLRTLAESTSSPAAILAGLNRRLLGRTQGGFATCLVLCIEADGSALLANAGHLSPFRDGQEWEVPASLPLGLSPYAEYDEIRVYLKEAETLTILTDGVLEARNEKGELYGFERLAALMRGRPTAEQVAEAACGFGQDDDITVVSVTRKIGREPVLQFAPAVAAI